MRHLPSLAFTSFSLCLALSACSASHAGDADFSWKGPIAPGSVVELRNINGELDVEPGTGAELEVVATKKVRDGSPADIKIEVVKHAAGITVCAIYPAPSGAPANECKPGGGRMDVRRGFEGTVNFRLKVPARVRLQGRTVNGDINVGALAEPVDVQTVNGSVQVDSTGELHVKTVNGSIKARLVRTAWQGQAEVATVNGSVDVSLPASASTDVKAATVNGSIDTDFGLPVEGKWGPKTARGTIGAGGRLLKMESVNGSVRLRKKG